MSGAPGDLYAAAQTLLAAAADALETSPGGPIALQLITQSLPVFDCAPALFVHAGGPSIGDTYPLQPPLQPMQRSVTTGFVDVVLMTVTVIRCVSIIEGHQQSALLPLASEINKDAEVCYGDLWAIWNHLLGEHRSGDLFQSPSGRREFTLDPAVAIRTSGGVGGWEIPCRFQLPGYAGGPS